MSTAYGWLISIKREELLSFPPDSRDHLESSPADVAPFGDDGFPRDPKTSNYAEPRTRPCTEAKPRTQTFRPGNVYALLTRPHP
jgi:hypothetical protein